MESTHNLIAKGLKTAMSDLNVAVMSLSNDIAPIRGFKRITVKDKSTEKHYVVDEDGYLKCAHSNITVEPPCCSSPGSSGYIECGCDGMYSVWCSDCRNADMSGDDMDSLVGKRFGGEDEL